VPRSTLRRTACAGALCLTATGLAAPAAARASALDVHHKRLSPRIGHRLSVTGHLFGLPPNTPAPTAALQVRRRGHWATLDRDRLSGSGRFVLRRRARAVQSGRARLRLSTGQTRPLGRLTVFRYAEASWYGPGLYGNALGCGGTLSPGRIGVANKSLPCGTKLTLRHGTHTVRVRVIDRGPYVAGREFDLTAATARRLHFQGPGAILVSR
jgi:peptidoglycan lytic transglycosylase